VRHGRCHGFESPKLHSLFPLVRPEAHRCHFSAVSGSHWTRGADGGLAGLVVRLEEVIHRPAPRLAPGAIPQRDELCRSSRGVHSSAWSPACSATWLRVRRTLAASRGVPSCSHGTQPGQPAAESALTGSRVKGRAPAATRRVSSLRCGRAAPRARRECKFEHLSDASQVGLHYPKDCAMCVVVCSKNDAASCVDRVTGEVANRAAGRLTESDTGREVQVVAKVAV
jgi:hypothetical protein